MVAAFAYLIFNTTRNRVLSQLRRLKQPRYAIGLVLGLLYFYSVFFRRTAFAANGTSPFFGATAELLAPLLAGILIAGIWIFGGDRTALAFSEAEVSMLLTAPVTRRELIIYKLARTQVLLILNSIIWVYVFRRGPTQIPSGLVAVAIWSVFTTFSLHRMAIALMRAKNVERRSWGNSRQVMGVIIGLTFAGVYGASIGASAHGPRAPGEANPFAKIRDFFSFLQEPFAHNLLAPFRYLVEPVFAHSVAQWAAAMLPALAIAIVHVIWVLRSDTAFEEAAAIASAEQAKMIATMRARRSGFVAQSGKKASRTIALSSSGNPAVAIVWKNFIALKRTFQPGMLLRMSLIMLLLTIALGWKTHDIPSTTAVMAMCMTLVATLVCVAGFRTDLRTDMLHLPFLKSLPLRSSDLVAAEIISGVLPLVVVQFVLLLVAFVATSFTDGRAAASISRLAVMLVISPVPLFAVDLALFTLANGAAVLFPAWLRLGTAGPGGVEMMGQAMLSMVGSALALLVLLLGPGAIGAGIFYLLRSNTTVALAATLVVSGALLITECYFASLMLGESFASAEPQQVT